ncbi:Membrane protein involved in the export of O-antigen and teichoic acid (Fragment) [Durusdinium trenchii]|uniref:Membrane protein involved in the export of O-antigen and teichoic acid n=1 Tax=Durusdinium trenchii TaxID=1381693 RepID=A0ABP0K8X0_9DINO
MASVSTNGGDSWSTPARISAETGQRKPSLSCVARTGTCVVAWTDFDGESMFTATSRNRGQTFSSPVRIRNRNFGNGNVDLGLVQPPSVRCLDLGSSEVCLLAARARFDFSGAASRPIVVFKSLDAENWQSTATVATSTSLHNAFVSGDVLLHCESGGALCLIVFDGADVVGGVTQDDSKVMVTRSTDQGATWSNPTRIATSVRMENLIQAGTFNPVRNVDTPTVACTDSANCVLATESQVFNDNGELHVEWIETAFTSNGGLSWSRLQTLDFDPNNNDSLEEPGLVCVPPSTCVLAYDQGEFGNFFDGATTIVPRFSISQDSGATWDTPRDWTNILDVDVRPRAWYTTLSVSCFGALSCVSVLEFANVETSGVQQDIEGILGATLQVATPTEAPSDAPSSSPTTSPTSSPTTSPTRSPTQMPTQSPTATSSGGTDPPDVPEQGPDGSDGSEDDNNLLLILGIAGGGGGFLIAITLWMRRGRRRREAGSSLFGRFSGVKPEPSNSFSTLGSQQSFVGSPPPSEQSKPDTNSVESLARPNDPNFRMMLPSREYARHISVGLGAAVAVVALHASASVAFTDTGVDFPQAPLDHRDEEPSLVCLDAVNCAVVFEETEVGNEASGQIKGSISVNGGTTWTAPVAISSQDRHRAPVLACVASQDLCVAVWRQLDETGAGVSLFSSRSVNKGFTWSTPVELPLPEATFGVKEAPAISCSNASGGPSCLVAVRAQGIFSTDNSRPVFIVQSFDGGATWEGTLRVAASRSLTNTLPTDAEITCQSDGSACLLVFDGRDIINNSAEDDSQVMVTRTLDLGQSWNGITRVEFSDRMEQQFASIGAAENPVRDIDNPVISCVNATHCVTVFDAVVATNTPNLVPEWVDYAFSIDGGRTWSQALTLDFDNTNAMEEPSVSCSVAGVCVASWGQGKSGSSDGADAIEPRFAISRDGGASWTSPLDWAGLLGIGDRPDASYADVSTTCNFVAASESVHCVALVEGVSLDLTAPSVAEVLLTGQLQVGDLGDVVVDPPDDGGGGAGDGDGNGDGDEEDVVLRRRQQSEPGQPGPGWERRISSSGVLSRLALFWDALRRSKSSTNASNSTFPSVPTDGGFVVRPDNMDAEPTFRMVVPSTNFRPIATQAFDSRRLE